MRRLFGGLSVLALIAFAPLLMAPFTAEPIDDPKDVVSDSLGAYWDSTEVAAAISDSIPTIEKQLPISFRSPVGSTGKFWEGGMYLFFDDAATSFIGTATKVLGTANGAYEAHVGIVSNGGNSGLNDTLDVIGTMIDEATGTRTAGDSVAVVFLDAALENDYQETAEKFTGQVTVRRRNGTDADAGGYNIGFAKYHDFRNRDFIVRGFDFKGRAGATDVDFNIKIWKHEAAGWDYAVGGIAATGYPTIIDKLSDYTERAIISGEDFVFKRTAMTDTILGSASEGILVEFTTADNNAVEQLSGYIDVDIIR